MGSVNDKPRCCAQVSGTGSYGWLHKSNCQKPVKVTVDGKHYCATHNPEAKAKRAKASEDRYNAKNAAYEAERRAQAEQAHRAACFDLLVGALELALTGLELAAKCSPINNDANFIGYVLAADKARAALEQARNKP